MTQIRYAGFWIRFVALILDSLILGIPFAVVGFALAYSTGLTWITNVTSILEWVLIIYLVGTKGGTPGKLILGLRVVDDKGKFIGVPNALLRELCKIISALILGIGFLMIAWDKKKQGLHDRLAKTYVVYK